jgi:hypothetical protein
LVILVIVCTQVLRPPLTELGAGQKKGEKRPAFVILSRANLYKTAHPKSMVDKWNNFAFRLSGDHQPQTSAKAPAAWQSSPQFATPRHG